MPTPNAHAMLSPSSASRWLACTPSARMNEKFTSRFGAKESPFAEEGTKAHAIGELKIRLAVYQSDEMCASKLSRMSKAEREFYPGINKHRFDALRADIGDVDERIAHATDSYCDVVMHKYLTAKAADPTTQLLLEQRIDLDKWVPNSFGSSDAVIVSDSMLEVIDFKAGRGILVNAHNNPQLRLYALGAVESFHLLYDFPYVRYTIVQPRLDNLSEEVMTVEDLLHWAETEVVDKAKQAWAGTGAFVPGEHCRFCSAKAVCTARVAQGLKVFEYGLENPGVISDEQVAEILPYLDAAESWIQDIRAYAENQALHGQRIRGYKLVHGKRPNRQWSDAEEVKAQLLRSGYDPTTFEETKLKAVGAVEKLLGKAAFRALLEPLVHQGEGKLILVPESDKRQEYSSAEAAFSDLLDTNN